MKVKIDKTCTCGKHITTEQVTIIGTNELGVWYNCPFCGTTGLKPMKNAAKLEIQVPIHVLKAKEAAERVFWERKNGFRYV